MQWVLILFYLFFKPRFFKNPYLKFQGICEELTYEEIQTKYPDDFAARDTNKFHYRYPRGIDKFEKSKKRLTNIMV